METCIIQIVLKGARVCHESVGCLCDKYVQMITALVDESGKHRELINFTSWNLPFPWILMIQKLASELVPETDKVVWLGKALNYSFRKSLICFYV